MIMIQRAIACSRLITPLLYSMRMKARPLDMPTQAPIMLPFTPNYLHDNPGSKRYPKKVGRGPGSGKGKTSARGHKGTNARSGGGVSARYEGGQTPIHRRLPKYGRGRGTKLYPYLDYLNLGKLQYYIDRGLVNTQQTITIKTLADIGIVKKVKYGLKMLSKGADNFRSKIKIEVTDASKTAIKKIQQCGGQVKLVYLSNKKFKQFMKPEKNPLPIIQGVPEQKIVRKISRIQSDRGIKIEYLKPKWKIEEQKLQSEIKGMQDKFIYPVPRLPNPEKIHKRRQKPYRVISYKL